MKRNRVVRTLEKIKGNGTRIRIKIRESDVLKLVGLLELREIRDRVQKIIKWYNMRDSDDEE